MSAKNTSREERLKRLRELARKMTSAKRRLRQMNAMPSPTRSKRKVPHDVNPAFDPELWRHSVRLVIAGTEAGWYTFREFIENTVSVAGREVVEQNAEKLQEAWEATRELDDRLDEAGSVAEVLESLDGRNDDTGGSDDVTSIKNEIVNELREGGGRSIRPANVQVQSAFSGSHRERVSEMSYRIQPRMFGSSVVVYDCPGCGEEVESPQDEVGQTDNCPECSHEFVVPGPDKLMTESGTWHFTGLRAPIRWILALPAGILAAAIVAFPVHWFVMVNFTGMNREPLIEIGNPETLRHIELLLQALFGPLAFVYCAGRTAPGYKRLVAVLLAVALVLGVPLFIHWWNSEVIARGHGVLFEHDLLHNLASIVGCGGAVWLIHVHTHKAAAVGSDPSTA